MAESATDTGAPVIFLWPDGTEFSNDPDWQAARRMEAYAVAHPGAPRVGTGPSDDTDFSEYDDMDGPALKAAAKEKGVDITGLKKIGLVRAALVAHDEAVAAGSDDSDDDDDEEDDTEDDESDESTNEAE